MRVLLITFLTLFSLHAGSIAEFAQKQGYITSYKKGLEEARKSGKPMMLVMVTHYCPWCRKFERATLSKKSINEAVHKNFVPVIINRDRAVYPKAFDVPRIPTVFFVDPKNEEGYWESPGYVKKSDFATVITEAVKLYKERLK